MRISLTNPIFNIKENTTNSGKWFVIFLLTWQNNGFEWIENYKLLNVFLQSWVNCGKLCPWDQKQTMSSLRNLTIEETYELSDAIIQNDLPGVKEELGDLMLHMVFYSKIGEEQSAFDVADVLNSVCEKLIHRHPHIYGDIKVEDEEEVKKNWEQLKLQEGKKSILEGVPNGLPSLNKAVRIQEKVAQVGFEWERIDEVSDKVKEEWNELDEAISSKSKNEIEEEFGDLLFALVNYSRFLKLDPEAALERCNLKFKKRFEWMENEAEKQNKSLSQMNLKDQDELWNQAKVKLK